MNSIRDRLLALDTNEFIFALRRDPDYPACEALLFDHLTDLRVYMPLQILLELQRNLSPEEFHGVLVALNRADSVSFDYSPASRESVEKWETMGAKKGDAVIIAHPEANAVEILVSENRHFLTEVPDLPFQVLTSEQALDLL